MSDHVYGFYLQFLILLICLVFNEGSRFLPNYPKKELWPYYQIKCDLNCLYGYKTDMEGRYYCKCYDPCENIYCHSGTKCVVDVPKRTDCEWSSCRAKAHCQDFGIQSKKKTSKKIYLFPNSNKPQQDEGSVTSSEERGRDVCGMPLDEAAKQCKKLRKRWYFDPVSGQCLKFRGCRTGGNNFGRKKRCKRKCLRKYKLAKRKGRKSRRLRG